MQKHPCKSLSIYKGVVFLSEKLNRIAVKVVGMLLSSYGARRVIGCNDMRAASIGISILFIAENVGSEL